MALSYPDIDPVIVQIGPFALRWYALAYLAGLLLGWWYMRWQARRPMGRRAAPATPVQVDDFLVWATVGVILGGRLGYVLFYKPAYYLSHPMEILQIWSGGMAFHGGVLGLVVAIVLFCRLRDIRVLGFGDMVCAAAPIGLFFGRIANFINGELFGRPAPDVPWAMVFPGGGPLPRHPSQLYEAALEGLVLFVVLWGLLRVPRIRAREGTITGVFFLGYGVSRAFVELFRQPDAHLGVLSMGMTMGQWLSLPMILVGLVFLVLARDASSGNGSSGKAARG